MGDGSVRGFAPPSQAWVIRPAAVERNSGPTEEAPGVGAEVDEKRSGRMDFPPLSESDAVISACSASLPVSAATVGAPNLGPDVVTTLISCTVGGERRQL